MALWSPVFSVPLCDFRKPKDVVTIFIVCSGAIFLEIWRFVTNFDFKEPALWCPVGRGIRGAL
jgi:hypothetical protein